MNTGRYKSIKSADAPYKESGFLKAWISLLADFTTLQAPVLSNTPLIGEQYTIGTSHVFASGKDPLSILVNKDTLEIGGESVGDKGSLSLKFTPKMFIKGDGPIVLEVVNNIINEPLIVFVQDQCSPAKIIQLGCDCNYVEIIKVSYQSGTRTGGAKGYEIEFESPCKYFYNGTLSERA